MTAVVDPIAELARVEAKKYESWRESPDLKAIDEVISIENILSSSQKGSSLMWQESFWREDVPSVKKGFWTSYISLVKNNFFVFLNERSKTFLEVQNANIYLQSKVSLDLFEPLMKDTPPMSLNIDLPGFHTINYDIYKKAIQLLTLDFSNAFFTCIRNLLNSLWIPLAGLIFFLIKNIIKKKKFLSFCSIAVLLKVPLIYLTMPGRAFMYYYPVYYIGWLCIFIEIIFLVERSRKKINYIMQSD
ncbi:MAG: hypothetical protein K2P14_06195 [Anaeroplasmataceae bacterium]|nr:hypothetical protein [Anaeroplasmataceae bacterium]